MKPLIIFAIFISQIAAAAVDPNVLNNEELKEPQVQRPFNLRASDGSVVTMLPNANNDSLKKASLIGKTHLQLVTESGKQINFVIASMPKKVNDLSDLYMMSIKAESSGQNLGLQIIRYSDDSSLIPPTTRTTTESCTSHPLCAPAMTRVSAGHKPLPSPVIKL